MGQGRLGGRTRGPGATATAAAVVAVGAIAAQGAWALLAGERPVGVLWFTTFAGLIFPLAAVQVHAPPPRRAAPSAPRHPRPLPF